MKRLITLLMMLAVAAWTGASFAGEVNFTFINKSGKAILELYLAEPGTYKWGQNLLTAGRLEDGASASVKFSSDIEAASWDLRILDAGDSSREWEQISFKGVSSLTLYVRDGMLTIKKE